MRSGTLSDKDNEGHPGWTIDQIAGAVSNVGGTPNAVLLHAGTNDCNTYGWETAHERLGKLIDVVTAKWPKAAVVVAKIVPSQSANTNNNIKSFNSKVQGEFFFFEFWGGLRSLDDHLLTLMFLSRCCDPARECWEESQRCGYEHFEPDD